MSVCRPELLPGEHWRSVRREPLSTRGAGPKLVAEVSREIGVPYADAFDVAVLLLRGVELRLVDEHGQRWLATMDSLDLLMDGMAAPIVEGTAGDVAIEVVRRRLRPGPSLLRPR